jgi:hypothetical protein
MAWRFLLLVLLFQARDQVFVAGRTFGVVRQMLAVLDKVDSTSFSNDEEDVVLRFAPPIVSTTPTHCAAAFCCALI